MKTLNVTPACHLLSVLQGTFCVKGILPLRFAPRVFSFLCMPSCFLWAALSDTLQEQYQHEALATVEFSGKGGGQKSCVCCVYRGKEIFAKAVTAFWGDLSSRVEWRGYGRPDRIDARRAIPIQNQKEIKAPLPVVMVATGDTPAPFFDDHCSILGWPKH